MSIQFEHGIDIARPPQQVFSLIEDFSQTPRWLASCEGMEKLTAGPNEVGTQLRYFYRDAAHTGTLNGQITRHIPGRRLSFECADHLVGVLADFQLTENDIGTHLVHRIEIVPKTFLVRMVAPLIRSQIPKQIVAAMEVLRSLLETGDT